MKCESMSHVELRSIGHEERGSLGLEKWLESYLDFATKKYEEIPFKCETFNVREKKINVETNLFETVIPNLVGEIIENGREKLKAIIKLKEIVYDEFIEKNLIKTQEFLFDLYTEYWKGFNNILVRPVLSLDSEGDIEIIWSNKETQLLITIPKKNEPITYMFNGNDFAFNITNLKDELKTPRILFCLMKALQMN